MSSGVQIRDMGSEVSTSLIKLVYRELLQPTLDSDELDTLDTVLDGLVKGSDRRLGDGAHWTGKRPSGAYWDSYAWEIPMASLGCYYRLPGGQTWSPGRRHRSRAVHWRGPAGWYGEPDIDLVVAACSKIRVATAQKTISTRQNV